MRGRVRVLLGLMVCGGLIATPLGVSTVGHAAPAAAQAVAAGAEASQQMRVRLVGASAATRDGAISSHAEIVSGQAQPFFAPDELAKQLGIDAATLQQDLQEGETVLQIAGSRYGSAAALATALLIPVKAKLDYAVAVGALSADQAGRQYAALLSGAETMVVTPHPQFTSTAGARFDAAAGKEAGTHQAMSELIAAKQAAGNAIAASCDTTTDAFYGALQAGGQTPLAVCQRTNPVATVDSISAAIDTALTNQLNADVAAGKTTAAQAAQVLADIKGHTADWLTSAYGAGK